MNIENICKNFHCSKMGSCMYSSNDPDYCAKQCPLDRCMVCVFRNKCSDLKRVKTALETLKTQRAAAELLVASGQGYRDDVDLINAITVVVDFFQEKY